MQSGAMMSLLCTYHPVLAFCWLQASVGLHLKSRACSLLGDSSDLGSPGTTAAMAATLVDMSLLVSYLSHANL